MSDDDYEKAQAANRRDWTAEDTERNHRWACDDARRDHIEDDYNPEDGYR